MVFREILKTDNVSEMVDKINDSLEDTVERSEVAFSESSLTSIAQLDNIKLSTIAAVQGASGNAIPFKNDSIVIVAKEKERVLQITFNNLGVIYNRVFTTTWSAWKKADYVNLAEVQSTIQESKIYTASASDNTGTTGFQKGNSITKPFIGFSNKDSTAPTDYVWIANGSSSLNIMWAKDANGTDATATTPTEPEKLTTFKYIGIGTQASTAITDYYWTLNPSVVAQLENTTKFIVSNYIRSIGSEIQTELLPTTKLTIGTEVLPVLSGVETLVSAASNEITFKKTGTYLVELDYNFSIVGAAAAATSTIYCTNSIGDVAIDVLSSKELNAEGKSLRITFEHNTSTQGNVISFKASLKNASGLNAKVQLRLIKITSIK